METFEAQHPDHAREGPRAGQPVLHPDDDHRHGRRPGLDPVRSSRDRTSRTVSACASWRNAIGEALRLLQHGDADVIIAGGAEATITPMAIAGFGSLGACPHETTTPSGPAGRSTGIGTASSSAKAPACWCSRRKSTPAAAAPRILCELAGYGATGDAYHITAPSPDGEGAARAMKRALHDAELAAERRAVHQRPRHFDAPPATRIETTAVKRVFGEHARRLMMSSTKSMTGHLLGAAGGLEAAVARPGDLARGRSTDHQLREPGSRMRPRLRSESSPRGAS